MSHIYTVTFHPPADGSWLASARHHDRRVSLAEMAVDSVSGDDPAVVALPAGFLRASTLEARDRLAEAMLQVSRRAQVAVVFGIDVAPEGEWAPLAGADASFAYACDSGRRVLWPATQVKASSKHPPRPPSESRYVVLADRGVGIVISNEAFNGPLRRALINEAPTVILLLAHSSPSDRWSGALASWRNIAPTFVVAPMANGTPRERDSWIFAPPPEWEQDRVAETGDMTIRRYREWCPLCELVRDQEAFEIEFDETRPLHAAVEHRD
jgi:hypothetical protein